MTHIFLTGEIQVGKSTVIAKTLSILDICPGGFKTYFGPDRGFEDRFLYINPAAEPQTFYEENIVVSFTKSNPPQVYTKVYDTFGTALIWSAKENSSLILMDECGSLERDAFIFQKEVLDTLDSNLPILGVIKLASTGWTDIIRSHPQVKLITVTENNRDTLPPILAGLLAPEVLRRRA